MPKDKYNLPVAEELMRRQAQSRAARGGYPAQVTMVHDEVSYAHKTMEEIYTAAKSHTGRGTAREQAELHEDLHRQMMLLNSVAMPAFGRGGQSASGLSLTGAGAGTAASERAREHAEQMAEHALVAHRHARIRDVTQQQLNRLACTVVPRLRAALGGLSLPVVQLWRETGLNLNNGPGIAPMTAMTVTRDCLQHMPPYSLVIVTDEFAEDYPEQLRRFERVWVVSDMNTWWQGSETMSVEPWRGPCIERVPYGEGP